MKQIDTVGGLLYIIMSMTPGTSIIKKLAILLLITALSACAGKRGGEPPQSDWPFYQGGPLHQGFVDTEAIPFLQRKWLLSLAEIQGPPSRAPQEYASPAAGDDRVYFGSVRGKGVKAVDYRSGEVLWRFYVEKGVESSPALYEKKLYFGANDGFLYALDAISGTQLWRFDAGAEIVASPVAEGGVLFFISSADILYALDAVTGKLVWRYRSDGAGIYSVRLGSSPAYRDGTIYTGFSDGSVAALIAHDGSLLWKRKLSIRKGIRFADIDSSPVVDGDRIYVSTFEGWLYALEIKNGETIWSYKAGGASTPAIDEENLYFADKDGRILALDKESGEILWERRIKEGVPSSPISIGDHILFGSSDEKMYLLEKEEGKIVDTYSIDSGFSASPAYYKGIVYAVSNAGYAHAIGR